MIERYQRTVMKDLWSLENKFNVWLDVELSSCFAWADFGTIPYDEIHELKKNAKVDVARILEIENKTKHDVIAFTRAIAETCGEESKWFHYGLTSTDVVDTAQAVILKQVNDLLEEGIVKMISVLRKQALRYRNTPMIGRTHGIHAEPTTFGLTLLLWLDDMERNLVRFRNVRQEIEVGKISGAVGTHANVPLQVEEMICKQLGIGFARVSTQVLQRDRHANYLATLALIGASIENMALQIRHLQRTEVSEVQEYFDAGQKGSSAMPHKRNPISSENVCGLARVLRGYVTPAFENIALWHERDISHSSAERVILPDATSLLDYMLNRFTNILDRMIVHEKRMLENINASYGLVFSQQVLLSLIEKGLTREKAYDIVQPIAMKAWDEQVSFRNLLTESSEIMCVLSISELDQCFSLDHHLANVDSIFERVIK